MNESMTQEIIAGNNIRIEVEKKERDSSTEVTLRMESAVHCRLQWGLSRTAGGPWQAPSHSSWPPGSIAFGDSAVQTPFSLQENENHIRILLERTGERAVLSFVLFYPETGTWDNNSGKNYHITLPVRSGEVFPPEGMHQEFLSGGEVLYETLHDIEGQGRLWVSVIRKEDCFRIMLLSNVPGDLVLHWGTAENSPFEWNLPAVSIWPDNTIPYDHKAVQTGFSSQDGMNQLILSFREEMAPAGIPFVLTFREEERWLNNRGQNFYIPVRELTQQNDYPGPPRYLPVAREIIAAEMGRNSWTLMHRFNLCYDLLDRAGSEEDGLALLFVWLRYSFLRQLDWQRNYNTKPKELSHAQDRLTLKLAGLYSSDPGNRELIRLILSTLGRGGEGQRIRDEILHIMHRHRIKEVSGHFLEEWHQKLHNNTTPDDIEICRAYLEFLRGNGDQERFYKTLEAGGVTRERLESFERPIVSAPDFVPHLKDALIHDFEQYLKLLRSVHSGTDIESAAGAAGYLLSGDAKETLEVILRHRDDTRMTAYELVESITRVRISLNNVLNAEKNQGKVRDALYLDIALEGFLRLVVERSLGKRMDRDVQVDLIHRVLMNAEYSSHDHEFTDSALHWERLKGLPRFSQDWALHAKSVLDRLGRAVSDYGEGCYRLLQPIAEYFGKAFQADSWVITMFSEEIIRGRLLFVLSQQLHHIDPVLRRCAKLGDWQVISSGQARGRVEIIDILHSVQGSSYDRPTIIIAEKVRGDEEPPEGVKAIITPDTVDLVSHIAIRARNAHLLFATCYDSDCFNRLKAMGGRNLDLTVNAAGDVVFQEADDTVITEPSRVKFDFKTVPRPDFAAYALSRGEFRPGLLGGKSMNLKGLQEALPDWIHIPAAAALPFGVFERVLSLEMNKGVAAGYDEMLRVIEDDPGQVLAEVRALILSLKAPEELPLSLRRAMEEAGMAWPEPWDAPWMCIKRVWASKWNDRAYLSRRARAIPQEDLFMAVLIQEVVRAEYAFVIHTVNPFSGDKNELYAEVVSGLGETLVGNYPGRALGFTCSKTDPVPRLTAYPSKNFGLYGGGVIFRSDSNGEDLESYAGAGLYDSVLLEPPRKVFIKYSEEPMVWDDKFRQEVLRAIARLGITVEKILGTPQDIEGAYAEGKFYIVQTRPQV